MLLPLSSSTVKFTVGVLPAVRIFHAGNGQVDACQKRVRVLRISGYSICRHHVCSFDGGVERQLALRNMAIVALSVVRLESARVIGAGGEVEIVMAGAAGSPRRLRQICLSLRRAGGLAVTNFATLRFGWIHHGRKVAD